MAAVVPAQLPRDEHRRWLLRVRTSCPLLACVLTYGAGDGWWMHVRVFVCVCLSLVLHTADIADAARQELQGMDAVIPAQLPRHAHWRWLLRVRSYVSGWVSVCSYVCVCVCVCRIQAACLLSGPCGDTAPLCESWRGLASPLSDVTRDHRTVPLNAAAPPAQVFEAHVWGLLGQCSCGAWQA